MNARGDGLPRSFFPVMDHEIPNVRVHWREWTCSIHAFRYASTGNVGLQLYEKGIPMATASINPSSTSTGMGVILPDDEVMIKDYTENEGIAAALQEAGIIARASMTRPGCAFPVYKLLVALPADLVSRETVLAKKGKP